MQQDKKNIILHVGLHKTGTSFLQKQVFPYLSNVYHSGYGNPNIYNTPLACLVNLHYIYFDKKGKYDFLKAKTEINKFIENLDCETVLHTSENLGGYGEINFKNNNFAKIYNTEILKQLFPNAKIFVVFRKQDEWLESVYNAFVVKRKKDIKINDYLGYKNKSFIKGKYCCIQEFNWLSLYELYVKTFGAENVLALPYELMKEDVKTFLDKFYDFSGIESYYPENIEKVNPRSKELITEVNLLLRGYLNFIEFLRHDKVKKIIRKNDKGLKRIIENTKIFNKKLDYTNEKLSEEQKSLILKIHEKSNRKLSKLIGIDMGEYGYY